MKRLVPAVLLVMLSACNERKPENLNNAKETKIMEKQDKQQIERLLNEYKNSLNTSDASIAQSLYTKDGVFMPTGAPSAIGSENILKSYEFIFSQIQLNIEFYIDEIVVNGDYAFARTTSKGSTLIHASGATVPEENRELFVLHKEGGTWRIARYMFNKMK
ncbi:MAG: SgcJ/EcaC family oxidoreductase [Bacteroidetes bacterium]|nr:SgcJ/EcaC family oxidoreductase [Bacteroidota bacterium]